MKLIAREELAARLSYDAESGHFTALVDSRTWRTGSRPEIPHKSTGYLNVRLLGETYLAHRLAWLYVYGEWPERDLDHINGIRTDNRIANLREVNDRQNQQNIRGPKATNRSGYLGVSPAICKSKPWQAKIRVDGSSKYLGLYATPEEAHEAYLEAKRRLHTHGTI